MDDVEVDQQRQLLRLLTPDQEIDLIEDFEAQRISQHDLLFATNWQEFLRDALPHVRHAIHSNRVHIFQLKDNAMPLSSSSSASIKSKSDDYDDGDGDGDEPTNDRGLLSHVVCVHFLLNQLTLHRVLAHGSAPIFLEAFVRHARPARAMLVLEYLPHACIELPILYAHPERFGLHVDVVSILRRFTLEQVWAHLLLRLLGDLACLNRLGFIHGQLKIEYLALRLPRGAAQGSRRSLDDLDNFSLVFTGGLEQSTWKVSERATLCWSKATSSHPPSSSSSDLETLVISTSQHPAFSTLGLSQALVAWLKTKNDHPTIEGAMDLIRRTINFVSEQDRDALPPHLDFSGAFGAASLARYLKALEPSSSSATDKALESTDTPKKLPSICPAWLKRMHWYGCDATKPPQPTHSQSQSRQHSPLILSLPLSNRSNRQQQQNNAPACCVQ